MSNKDSYDLVVLGGGSTAITAAYDEYPRTNVQHIFAAGDTIGSAFDNQMATPVGNQDALITIHNMFNEKHQRKMDHMIIPRTMFTQPEVATVGSTELSAQKKVGLQEFYRTHVFYIQSNSGT